MILSVILALGETWEEFVSKGQDKLLLRNNLFYYSKNFDKVYVFSYGTFSGQVLKNVFIIPNKYRFHRFIYSIILPLLNFRYIRSSTVIRGMQLSSAPSCLVSKLFFGNRIVINYGYDYAAFAKHEQKLIRSHLFRIMERFFLPFVNDVIVTNPLFFEKIRKNNKNVIYIPNGVNTTMFSPKKIKKKIDIVFVGRLASQKNLFLLLNAVVKIKQPLKLSFIGAGDLKGSLQQFAYQKKIHLQIIDPLPHTELVKMYNEAKLFVLPSVMEGNPKALLEAMSCSLPVIGTNVIGIRDIIINGENGLLVPLDADELAKAICKLIRNKRLREKLGRIARKTVYTNFESQDTWKKEIMLLKK